MIDDYGTDGLVQRVYLQPTEADACQIGCRLKEHRVDFRASFGTDIVLIHLIGRCETRVLILLHCLHVVQVNFVAKENNEGQVAILEGTFDKVKPVLEILERLLVSDVVG